MLLTFLLIIIFFFVVMFPFALFKVAKAKKTKCPACERDVKLVTNAAKCPFCKTKLFKHADGDYRISS